MCWSNLINQASYMFISVTNWQMFVLLKRKTLCHNKRVARSPIHWIRMFIVILLILLFKMRNISANSGIVCSPTISFFAGTEYFFSLLSFFFFSFVLKPQLWIINALKLKTCIQCWQHNETKFRQGNKRLDRLQGNMNLQSVRGFHHLYYIRSLKDLETLKKNKKKKPLELKYENIEGLDLSALWQHCTLNRILCNLKLYYRKKKTYTCITNTQSHLHLLRWTEVKWKLNSLLCGTHVRYTHKTREENDCFWDESKV